MVSFVEVVYWVTVLCFLGQKHLVTGGCSGKCCRGRNMGCSTTDWRLDRAFAKCYCDEDCVNTKDCCFDYFTECPAQDCAVSAWSFWSGCANPCQPSVRVRVRHVKQQPGNSGEPCPRLEERAGCREYRDHRGSQCGRNSGPAFITSSEFGKGRPKHDSYGKPLDPGFCVEFKMESRTAHCTVQNRPHSLWMRYITEGFKVCVACEPPALRNSGCQGDGQESDKFVAHPGGQISVKHKDINLGVSVHVDRSCASVAGSGEPTLQRDMEEGPENCPVHLSDTTYLHLHLTSSLLK